jgi:hypothetical protein
MTASFTELATSASNPIGRYFTIVSTIPSALLVGFSFVLLNTGAPWQSPDWEAAVRAVTDIGIGEAVVLALITFSVAIVLHPLQFAFVQFLEGYWGTAMVPSWLRAVRVQHYRAERDRLTALYNKTETARRKLEVEGESRRLAYSQALSRRDESARLNYLAYPAHPDHTMPTRLGNVLRRYETSAGFQYGLDATVVAPHLALIADKSHVDYLNDQRTVLDLAVRLCLCSLLATVAAVAVLSPYGFNLLVALIPYLAAYTSYRGAIVAAHHYGGAVGTLIDLNRSALYEALLVSRPQDSAAERRTNKQLTALLGGQRQAMIHYSAAPADSDAEPLATEPTGILRILRILRRR